METLTAISNVSCSSFRIFEYSLDSYSSIIDERVKLKFPLFHSLKYKGLGREMVKRETDLMLNKVVGTLPIDEVLTIHDGFIVSKDDEVVVDEHLTHLKVLNDFDLVKKEMK